MHYPFTKRLHTEKSKKNDESIVDWKNKGPVLKKKYIYIHTFIYTYMHIDVSPGIVLKLLRNFALGYGLRY